MKTRRSWRNQERLWNYLTPLVPPVVPVAKMTDAELLASPLVGKADKTKVRKRIEKEALRLQVQAILREET